MISSSELGARLRRLRSLARTGWRAVRTASTPALLGGLAAAGVAGVLVGTATRPTTATVVDRFDSGFDSTETGQEWAVAAGTWSTEDGRARVDVADGTALATVDPGVADGELTVGVPSGAEGAGVAFRVVDESNLWAAVASPGSNGWQVVRVRDGTRQRVADIAFAPTDGARVRVALSGRRITVEVEGHPPVQVVDPTPEPATAIGLLAADEGGRARWEDVRFEPAVAGDEVAEVAVPAADDFLVDGPLSIAESGVAWRSAAGRWRVVGGQALSAEEGVNLALVEVGSVDVETVALVRSVGQPGAGIVARYRHERDHLRLVSDPALRRWVLERAGPDGVEEIASLPGPPGARVALRVDGPTVSIEVEDGRLDDLAVPEPVADATRVGIVSAEADSATGVERFGARPLGLDVPQRGFPFADTFERDLPEGLGRTTDSGRIWQIRVGGWRLVEGAAAPTARRPTTKAFAVIPFARDGRLDVTMPATGNGAGVVVRYLDQLNHWSVTVEAQRWTARQIVDGDVAAEVDLGPVGPGPVRLVVVFTEAGMTVGIDGAVVGTLTAVDVPGAAVGLTYGQGSPARVRWDDLEAGPP